VNIASLVLPIMSILRAKYRPAAIQPSLENPRAENDITTVKKVSINLLLLLYSH